MNKLSALLGDRTGQKSEYQQIRDATYGSSDATPNGPPDQNATTTGSSSGGGNVAERMEYGPTDSGLSGFVDDWMSFLRRYACTLAFITLLVVFLALQGQRAAHRPTTSEDIGDAESVTSILHRPCQFYRRDASPLFGVRPVKSARMMPKVLQTSLGEPANQWGEVACMYYDAQWGVGSAGQDVKEYGMPSADINVDFASGPTFPNREPILGFGGAFTEATALNYRSLSKEGREAVLELLFGSTGLGYSLGRVHMNSCDFCVASYNFADKDGDFGLEYFDNDVQHDQDCGMIEMMVKADNISRTAWPSEDDHGLRVVASPWSPPPWMKAPTPDDAKGAEHAENMTGSATPSCLREGTGVTSKYAETWALFFSKFITAYKNLGIDLFAITPQNEPEFPAPWDACAYTAKVERDFIAYHLGPMLNKSHPDVKILMFDHNKDHAPIWAKTILNQSSPSAPFVDGTALHWYAGGMDRLLDGAVGSANMHKFMSMLRTMNVSDDHLVLGSEACHCPTTGYAGGDLKVAWARAERYAHTILADLAAGSNGWIEWNVLLDAIGGPNHLGNLCDSPLLAVPYRAKGGEGIPHTQKWEHAGHPFGLPVGDNFTRGELNARGNPAEYVDKGVVIQPIYFYMGHISRHVRPGSRAVHALVDTSSTGRTFRKEGQVVAGGGINDNARNGMEVTLWPCEGSTRQSWKLNGKGQLQVFGHDWLGKPTSSCVGKSSNNTFHGMLLTKCNKFAGSYDVVPVAAAEDLTEDSDIKTAINLVLKNGPAQSSKRCLVAKPLGNGGGAYGPRGGAQVAIGKCGNETVRS